MAFARRFYPGGAQPAQLVDAMGTDDAGFIISNYVGWPTDPGADFFVAIDTGSNNEEKLLASGTSGASVAVADRGQDGTAAVEHQAGAAVNCVWSATDADEANQVTNLLGNLAAGSLVYGAGTGTLPDALPIGGEGEVLSVSAEGAPEWVPSTIPLRDADGTVAGSLSGSDVAMIAGKQSVVFTSGAGTLTFPNTGFLNCLLSAVVSCDSASAYVVNLNGGTHTTLTLNCYTADTGSGVTATVAVTYIAVGV